MTNWFDEVIRDTMAVEASHTEAPKQDVNEMKEALAGLGYDVSNITITANKEPDLTENIGKKASVKLNLVVASNLTIKTQFGLYRVAKVVLPRGYIGVIADFNNGKYKVNFDANLSIKASDITDGYDGTDLTYLVDSVDLAPNEVSVL